MLVRFRVQKYVFTDVHALLFAVGTFRVIHDISERRYILRTRIIVLVQIGA